MDPRPLAAPHARDIIPRVKPNELTMRGRNNKKLRTGAGGFSLVYAGVFRPRGGPTTLVAVKYYKARLMRTEQDVDRFYEEALGHLRLSQLGRAHGCNIVPFFGVLEHSNHHRVKRAIVMQRMQRSLADLIRSAGADCRPAVPVALRLRMLAQVAKSLAVMHENHYQVRGEERAQGGSRRLKRARPPPSPAAQHLDVKPENVLLDKGSAAFISDFGLSRLRLPASQSLPVAATTRPGGDGVAGTPGYICPGVGG